MQIKALKPNKNIANKPKVYFCKGNYITHSDGTDYILTNACKKTPSTFMDNNHHGRNFNGPQGKIDFGSNILCECGLSNCIFYQTFYLVS